MAPRGAFSQAWTSAEASLPRAKVIRQSIVAQLVPALAVHMADAIRDKFESLAQAPQVSSEG